MTRPVEVVACVTCGGSEPDAAGRSLGAQLLSKLESAAADTRVKVSGVRCLWACKARCAVHLRAPHKPGYVLGNFEPSDAAAQGLIEYARAYGESADGAVPFRLWPPAVKGHFICRIPSLPSVDCAAQEDDLP